MGDRWNVECFLWCVKKCLCLLSWTWHLPQLRYLAAGVNKLLLQSAEVNGRVSSATVLWSLLLVVCNIWWEERSWSNLCTVSCWLLPLRPRYVSCHFIRFCAWPVCTVTQNSSFISDLNNITSVLLHSRVLAFWRLLWFFFLTFELIFKGRTSGMHKYRPAVCLGD